MCVQALIALQFNTFITLDDKNQTIYMKNDAKRLFNYYRNHRIIFQPVQQPLGVGTS